MLDIMKAVDEQLQVVIDGTMEDNKKETDSETRRYGEGFCAGIELAQRYIRNADVQPVVDTENMATVSDEFICKKCGIYLKDYIKVVMDEDNDGYIDEQHYDYEPKFCPECGAKVKDGDIE